MKLSTFFLLPVLAIAAACGGSGANSEEIPPRAAEPADLSNIPDDQQILSKAYDPNYGVPDDFYVDERAVTSTRSYSLHHVLDASSSYERCTDDLVVAQEWEQADNDSRAVSGYYVTSLENERYFEFVRELDYDQDIGNVGEPTSPGYARVFKCNYTDRSGVDRNLLDGYSGRLSVRPLTANSLQDLIEYLWQFRFFNVSRKAVVASYGSSDDTGFSHTLLLALVYKQGSSQCDRVDVVEWRFKIDAGSDEMMREFDTIRSFEAETRDGTAQLCK